MIGIELWDQFCSFENNNERMQVAWELLQSMLSRRCHWLARHAITDCPQNTKYLSFTERWKIKDFLKYDDVINRPFVVYHVFCIMSTTCFQT